MKKVFILFLFFISLNSFSKHKYILEPDEVITFYFEKININESCYHNYIGNRMQINNIVEKINNSTKIFPMKFLPDFKGEIEFKNDTEKIMIRNNFIKIENRFYKSKDNISNILKEYLCHMKGPYDNIRLSYLKSSRLYKHNEDTPSLIFIEYSYPSKYNSWYNFTLLGLYNNINLDKISFYQTYSGGGGFGINNNFDICFKESLKKIIDNSVKYIELMEKRYDYPLPSKDSIRFFIVKNSVYYTYEDKIYNVINNKSFLSPLYYKIKITFEKSNIHEIFKDCELYNISTTADN